MLKFNEGVRAKVAEETRERFSLTEESPASVRVDVSHVGNLRLKAKAWEGGGIEFEIDEPPERGGGGAGPAPLPLFIAGASSCFLMQCAKLAITRALEIDRLSITAVGRFDRRLDMGFREIVYDLRVEGKAGDEEGVRMLLDAERMCFTHNTLKKCVPLKVRLFYNDRLLAER